jgi:hypothetical protein
LASPLQSSLRDLAILFSYRTHLLILLILPRCYKPPFPASISILRGIYWVKEALEAC